MIQRLLAGLVMTLCLAGCIPLDRSYEVERIVPPTDLMIPPGQLTYDCAPDEKRTGYRRDSAGMLRLAVGVPRLTELPNGHQVSQAYRFTWERSFHMPAILTLKIDEFGLGKLTIKAWEKRTVYRDDLPAVVIKRHISLSSQQVHKFLTLIAEAEYWSMANFPCNSLGFDGSFWTIEGVNGGKYHYVQRWSPRDGPVRDIGERLIALSGVEFDRVY